MAAIVAIRDGLKDARTGNSPYFWTMVGNPHERTRRLNEGLNASWPARPSQDDSIEPESSRSALGCRPPQNVEKAQAVEHDLHRQRSLQHGHYPADDRQYPGQAVPENCFGVP
jgi:hypothetical protein